MRGLAALFVLLGGVACERSAPAAPANVVLLLVDTLRADHLSLYGYARDTSPELRRLAAGAVVFERARSQAPCTFPSVNSLLTSRLPLDFLEQPHGWLHIPDEIPALSTMLAERGVATYAVSASAIVRATPSRHNRVGGFGRGFAVFDEECLAKPAPCVSARALDLLDAGRRPFFLYLHYMEPHAPYAPPAEHVRRFAGPYRGDAEVAAGHPNSVERLMYVQRRPDLVSAADVQHLRDLYDEEIAYMDGQLAALFRALDERDLLDTTLVVLAADHGESFDEHASLTHCRTVYDSETWTPLVLWIPGVDGRRIDAAVENLDIVPTVLDYLGAPAPAGLQGSSLRPLIEGRDDGARVARSFHKEIRTMNDRRHKVMLDVTTGRVAAFDLIADPGETDDLVTSGRVPAALAPLRKRLVTWVARTEASRTARNVRAAQQVEAQLRSLGYLQ